MRAASSSRSSSCGETVVTVVTTVTTRRGHWNATHTLLLPLTRHDAIDDASSLRGAAAAVTSDAYGVVRDAPHAFPRTTRTRRRR
jgi:hypothetical protein